MTLRWLVPALVMACAWAEDPWDALAAASAKPAAEAESALEELLRLNPGFHAARFNLGTLLLGHDPAKAAAQLELATQAADAGLAADAYHNLALARQRQGRLEDALRAADEAAKRTPAYAPLRDEIRRIAIARADAARLQAEAEAKRLAFTGAPLPPARVGEPYDVAVPLRGGTAPYHVALDVPPPSGTTVTLDPKAPAPPVASPLPPGLIILAEGRFNGTPSAAGDFQVPIVVTDGAKNSAKGTVTLQVLPTPAITTTALPEAIIGLPYHANLAAVGLGTPSWTVSGLPAGLIASSDGTIHGTPTEAGSVTLQVVATEVVVPPLAPHAARREVRLDITDRFAPDAPPAPATVGAAYEHRLGVRGPAQEYRWQLVPGATGPFQIDADGRLHGTPTSAGTATCTALIQAADGRSRQVELPVTVNPRPLIAVGDPLRVTAGNPADVTIPHTGGTAPFTWKVIDGSLPTGIRLDPDGHFRGAAKDPGTAKVTVRLTDRWQASTQTEVPLQVDPATPNQQGDQANKDEPKPGDGKQDEKKPGDEKQNQPPKPDDQADGSPKPGAQKPDPAQAGKPDDHGQQQPDQAQKPDASGQPKDQNAQATADPGKNGASDGKSAADRAKAEAAQAAALDQMAAGRWLDQLPPEDRGVLRYQLLDGGERKPPQKQGKSW
jgi:Putative Ig domain